MGERWLEKAKRVERTVKVSIPVSVCCGCGREGDNFFGPDHYGGYHVSFLPEGWRQLAIGGVFGRDAKTSYLCGDCIAPLEEYLDGKIGWQRKDGAGA